MNEMNIVKPSAMHLKELFIEAGADDVGFVEVDRPALRASREIVREIMPQARILVSIVVALNRANLHTKARNLASYEIHSGEATNGFIDWVDALVSSENMAEYRQRFNDGESISWWQSLAYRPNYKCGHCLVVCPAGSDMFGEYKLDPKGYFNSVVRPLIERSEFVYAIPGSNAEKTASKNPVKTLKFVKPPQNKS